MKKNLTLILACAIFSCGTIFGQLNQSIIHHATSQPRSCGTMDHETLLDQQDPSHANNRHIYEQATESYIAAHQNSMSTQSVITVPVVVHVIWHTAAQNISDQQVQSQITVLNQDYGRTNPDASNTPAAFVPVAANTTIQFCLAQRDPNGNATNGIERLNTATTSFSANDNMKHTATGGLAAWDPTRYLNIWVCNLGGGLLGYGEFPTGTVSQTFGVVILYNSFGSQTIYPAGTYIATYNLGRTCTHEISHCFNLFHIWADDNGACPPNANDVNGDDGCADTPKQADATFGSPSGVVTDACTTTAPGIMYENYMDYSDDAVMNLFTNNQKTRMLAVLNTTPYNALQTSNGCTPLAGPPVAAFTLSTSSACAGTGVNFTDNSTGSPTSWSWTFPSGTPATSTVQNPTGIVWNTPGTYTVSLTATNANGNNTITHTITILALPTVTASATTVTICAGSSTTLSATGASTYNWNPGNHSGTPWTVTPATTTTYTVTGTGANGCTATATKTITVNPTPTVTATATSSSICAGSSTTLSATGASTYNWNPGNHNGASFTVTPAATTTYTVTGTSAAGCTATATKTITVNPTPTVTATATSSTVCAGSSTTLSATGASTYNWNPGNLNGSPVTVTPASTTTYTVTGTSAAGCTSTAIKTITVNPSPTVTATATSSSICAGSSTTLSATGASTYNWNPGNHNGTSFTVTPASTTTYTVTGTAASGCTNTANISITVNPLPTIALSGDTLICPGSSDNITASGATTYAWMPGNLSGNSNSVSPTSPTTYTVTGTDANGCTNSSTIHVNIDNPPAVPTITVNGNVLTSSVTGASYQWFLNGNPIPGATNPSYTTSQNGNYTVEVYDAAGCGSGQSAVFNFNTTGIAVSQIADNINLYPNPNDGHFHLNFNVVKTDNYVLEIHNTLGQIVYSESLNNFSGQYNKDIDLSVYGKGVYTIRLRNQNGESTIRTVVY